MRTANAVGPTHVRLTPEGSRRIRVYRNGDAHFKGITIVLNTRQVHTIDALLDMISEKIGLVMGCKKLFTLDGAPVKSMEQLQHNMEYVAASGPFVPTRYGRVASASLHAASLLTRSSSNFSAASRDDPLAQSGASKQSAPASLAQGAVHASLRHSRSIEPRRTVGRSAPSAQMNGPTNQKKTDERSKKFDGKKSRDSSKKRKTSKKKANNDEPPGDPPPVPAAEVAAPEAKENNQSENDRAEEKEENEGEKEEGEAAATEEEEQQQTEEGEEDGEKPPPRTRTEVEVVEHEEEEREQEGHFANGATPESARSVRAPTAQAEEEEAAEEGTGESAKENGEGENHQQQQKTTDE